MGTIRSVGDDCLAYGVYGSLESLLGDIDGLPYERIEMSSFTTAARECGLKSGQFHCPLYANHPNQAVWSN